MLAMPVAFSLVYYMLHVKEVYEFYSMIDFYLKKYTITCQICFLSTHSKVNKFDYPSIATKSMHDNAIHSSFHTCWHEEAPK